MKKFKLINNHAVAVNRRVASTSIGEAAVDKYLPDAKSKITFPEGATFFNWMGLLPTVTAEDAHPVVALIRSPLDRFKSACLHEGISAAEGLAKTGTVHFTLQSDLLVDGTALYRYETDFDEFVSLLGLDAVGSSNESTGDLELTNDEQAEFESIYAADIALYDSITEAGQTYTITATNEAKAAKIRELEAARYQAEIAGTTVAALGGAFVRTDKETQNELGKALALLTIDPTFEIDWKFPDGTIVHLAKAQIEAVAQEVFSHVQQTRTDYKVKAEAVAVATTQEELESITWL